MATLIRNGRIVTAEGKLHAHVRMEGGVIAAIGPGVGEPGDEVVDATGLLVLPGAIDVHTHLDMPAGDVRSSDDFESGTIAAAYGGTTTVIDFANPERGQPLPEAFAAWRGRADGRVAVDYGLHVSVVEVTDERLAEMDALLGEGVASFKLFTAYPDRLMVDDGALFRAMRWARRRGALLMVHCENGPVIADLAAELVLAGNRAPIDHARSRPARLEAEATGRVLALAEVAGASVYIVHVTCAEALEEVRSARRRGVNAFAETCPHYLHLSVEDLARPDLEGAKFVCSPPLRDRRHQAALWHGLAQGDLQVVSTDHCPFPFKLKKQRARDEFRRIPNGLPGIETRLPLLWQGVVEGRITPERFVDLLATTPAHLFGLHPKKGTIAVGADADVVLFDPARPVDLSHARLHMGVDYSPHEGRVVHGGPVKVYLRGELIVDGDRFLGRAGGGRYLRRKVGGAEDEERGIVPT